MRPPGIRIVGGLCLAVGLLASPAARAQGKTQSPHGNLSLECNECHSSDRWVPLAKRFTFRHEKSGFPLEGAHAQANCVTCHRSLVFTQVGTSCLDCHKDPHKGELGVRCESCHAPKTWSNQLEIFRVHNRSRLSLFAVHAKIDCGSCHDGQQPTEYANTPTTCAACHRKAAELTKSPNHVLAGFMQRCEECHSSVAPSWKQVAFKHPASFTITGAHTSVPCAGCHAEAFKGAPKDCVGCHLLAFNNAKNPNHLASGFPTQCTTCHRQTGWRPATFTDHGRTRFPLVGAHQKVDCTLCHVGGKYTGTPMDCLSCHKTAYQATRNPNHVTAGFPTACATCHNASAWRPSSFDHEKTGFPLAGAHQKVDCSKCHSKGFKNTAKECFACHQAAYNATRNPNHLASGFPTKCDSCHAASGWIPATLVDHSKTRFPLTGAHQKVDCTRCHKGGTFKALSIECYSCHQANYEATKNPNHPVAGFPTKCDSCHRTNAWRPASSVDHSKTRFPLNGAHKQVECVRCHVGGKYAGTPIDCLSCHQANFEATKNPNHVAGGFPTKCDSCHNVNAWRPATFTDHGKTRFPLTGAHQKVDCTRCHVGGKYTGTPTDCAACHQANYQATKNPNHVAAGFPTTCATCHATGAWRPASFDHGRTRFPLAGAHQKVDCARCHVGGKYTGTPTDCVACHQANYQATKDPNHVAGGFPTKCDSCHNVNAWRPASFTDHSKTRFPLTGAHQRVNCTQCHVGGKYTGTPTECASCHQAAYQATKNPNHVAAGFPTTCATCHATSAWRPATFDHGRTRFPLAGAHQKVDCARCHVGGKYAGTPTDCFSCHQANYQAVKNPDHVAAGFPTKCDSCHNVNAWRPASFTDHSKTRFPLTGAHQRVNCAQCHVGGKYTGTPTDCVACHQAKYQATKNPNHVAAGFPTTCATCHSVNAWTPATFDHGKTRFPLAGAHQKVDCARCHVGGKYAGTPTDCFSCHQANYQAVKNPDHVAAGFPTKCDSCHNVNAWRPASFTDHNKTRFPLTGAHQRVNCAQCHVGGKYTGTPTDCVSCHQAKYQATKNPNHVAAGFPTTCLSCHTTNAWTPATFDHGKTRFPLAGRHQTVACASCHVGGKYAGTPTDCFSCHQAKYQATKNPNHVAAGFPTTCATCHSVNGWTPATFDHGKTRFPLAGAHQKVDCARCHVGGKYAGTPTDCFSCHQANYQAVKNPDHVAAGFPTKCDSCHNVNAWRPASFTDHSKTRFPLTGAHQRVTCAQCHVGGKYTGTPTDCVSCHQAKYQATRNPNHVAAGFPTTCLSCHTTNAWTPATFDHGKTRFPLAGRHQTVACASCHVGGKYAGTPTDCFSCHNANYQATKNPNHVAGGFPTKCDSCHTLNGWRPATFADHSKTRFPLTGKHQTVPCATCHVGGKYTGTPTDCVACHQAAYQGSQNPNHIAAGFPTTCASCHTTNAWRPATFDHGKTRFPLAGRHQTVACASCHVGGKYAGTPTDCFSCHNANYQATKNPNHVAGGFPTKCDSCHNLNGWRPATFADHSKTRFPLTGKHQTVPCATCHVGGKYTGTPTDCVACHQAAYQGSQNPNHIAAGFPTTCVSCHTTNAWRPATFDHGKTRFPLTGKHQTVSCANCHVGGKYAGTSTDCVSCHQAKYQATKNPNHVAAGFPTTCATCHNTNGWTPATFNHSTTRFPLTGKHQTVACATCHVGGKYAGTATDCYACHQAKYQATKNPNHVAAGFPTTCVTCHTTNGWTPATFNHSTTRFPLTGKHQTVACATCHVGGKYAGTPTDCYACHQAKYQATKNPNHVAAGFPTTCATCHNTNGWTPANFNHSTTRFPLTGKHQTVACATCHVGGKYAGTPTDCYACHQAKYQATKNPNHVAAGFPTTCATCHNTNGWTPANFNHSTTRFPLTGKHQTVACATCHVGGKYAGTPTDCYACHQTKYQATKNPNHLAAGFPTTCLTCHTTNGWTPANFNHTWFRTPHHGVKVCGDCHVNASNYKAFECILCHEHSNKAKVDNDHKGRTGYSYASAACYQCHNR